MKEVMTTANFAISYKKRKKKKKLSVPKAKSKHPKTTLKFLSGKIEHDDLVEYIDSILEKVGQLLHPTKS